MHKDPQRTMKYTQHTLQQTVEIRSFMKRHLHLRRNPPHPFPPLYLQNGGNFGILHCWDGRKGNNPSRWTSSWKNITVSLTPVLGWIGSDVSDLGHPKMLPPPSAQGLADGAVFSFTWKVAKCPWQEVEMPWGPQGRRHTDLLTVLRVYLFVMSHTCSTRFH